MTRPQAMASGRVFLSVGMSESEVQAMEAGGARFVLTACSRCCGDLLLERDLWGEHYVCLQCGNEEVGSAWSPHVRAPVMTRTHVEAGHRQLGS